MDVQKLLFLYGQELKSANRGEVATWYDFVPYRYGAFSLTSYADRRWLVDSGLLADKENWELTGKGRQLARETANASIQDFANRHKHLRGEDLLAKTYREYPYYAISSEIATVILKNDEDALDRITSARPEKPNSLLMTIGYERRSLENFLNRLLQTGVTTLCDVRKNAISRKYGFSKSTLSNACEKIGINYEHLPELGIESKLRKGLQTEEDYRSLFKKYESRILPRQSKALQKIYSWLLAGESVALTCYERDADLCHRKCVADELVQMLKQGVLVESCRGIGSSQHAHPDGANRSPGGVRHL